MNRYAAAAATTLRASLMTALQYRANFWAQGAMSLFWLGWNLMPLVVLFSDRQQVAGWDRSGALVVIGYFMVLRSLLEGFINPSLVDVVEKIRTGSFDYILLKPIDAQFLVSTLRIEPWRLFDLLGGLGVIVYALAVRGSVPHPVPVLGGIAGLIAGLAILYSIWVAIVSLSFWAVKLDNLAYLFGSVFDIARWPVQLFGGPWRLLFTFVIPLGLMTTYPAMSLLGTLQPWGLAALYGAAGFALFASRRVWRHAVSRYTSASS